MTSSQVTLPRHVCASSAFTSTDTEHATPPTVMLAEATSDFGLKAKHVGMHSRPITCLLFPLAEPARGTSVTDELSFTNSQSLLTVDNVMFSSVRILIPVRLNGQLVVAATLTSKQHLPRASSNSNSSFGDRVLQSQSHLSLTFFQHRMLPSRPRKTIVVESVSAETFVFSMQNE